MTSPKLPRASIALATSQVEHWFKSLGREPFPFQRRAWREYLRGHSGLIHAHTGTGKTLAAFLGVVIEELALQHSQCPEIDTGTGTLPGLIGSTANGTGRDFINGTGLESAENSRGHHARNASIARAPKSRTDSKSRRSRRDSQLQVLWITPLRALAGDTEANLRNAIAGSGVPWSVEKRTSDTTASVRSKQNQSLPQILVTTPESATLLLTRDNQTHVFSELRLVVVDEWHELLGTKRGVQTELLLARLRMIRKRVQIWGLSATLGNLEQAMKTLVGPAHAAEACLIQGNVRKRFVIEELIPKKMDKFPWAGHLGHRMAEQVAQRVRQASSTLVFTNTRSQAEIWYRELLLKMPDLAGLMAVHHGSLDQKLRWWIEERLRSGRMRCCVCTSSLELGVDFPTVDQVIQIGSPKGCARLIQRAGRSGHQPQKESKVLFVPTHALELVEIAALKRAFKAGHLEHRVPLSKPLDVLAQHVVSMALGTGFRPEDLLKEVRGTEAYKQLSAEEWQWVIDFATQGGSSLAAYPDYHRIELVDGVYRVTNRRIAMQHRMSIGTIVSDSAMQVRYMSGKSLGYVEETFLAKVQPGGRFMLAGKLVQLVRIQDGIAWVKRGSGQETAVPRWMGGRMPLSSQLSQALRHQLELSLKGEYEGRAMRAVRAMLELQLDMSALPARDELLIETWKNRDGFHLFVYPFEGRLVHEGLAALWALRLSRLQPISFSMAMNDYGFMLVSSTAPPLNQAIPNLMSPDNVQNDILCSLNASEMCRRQFREVARVAGLVSQGYPGQRKLSKNIQASSNLLYDVFQEYDPSNLLLLQSRREVMEKQLEEPRLIAAIRRCADSRLLIEQLKRPSPLSFPLIADRLRDRLSSEKFADRIERLVQSLT